MTRSGDPSSASHAPSPDGRIRVRLARISGLVGTLAAGLLLAGGCSPTSSSPANHPLAGPPRIAAEAPEWPWWPRRVRIHPLTRLVEEADGSTHIEARVEFLDRRDDGTKASGLLELALFDERRGPDDRRVIDFWRADLGDETVNAARFDPVTRTYLFKLAIPAETFERDPILYVRHDSEDGRSMLDRLELRTTP